ncbi:response regulator [Pseudomonas sp. GD03842]|uniref:response regulator n=1 Tax=Pseudomonas sp. GD03842 TaxID=2975385 RepID=UPI00244AB015|nr:response regulator [Pseudomonas sp. GD03842]MDH0745620.1 response regulator [Pseudomonas sp. GD03842]
MTHRPAPLPLDEARRIEALERLHILDSLPEQAFDDIVSLAALICETPIALVSLIDRERQWFKACVGLPVRETHRDQAFCAHAILQPAQLLIVEDATLDERFAQNPLVLGEPFIRFYAGAPIVTEHGAVLGTVCVIDRVPRTLNPAQAAALEALARQTSALMQLREFSLLKDEQTRSLSRKVIDALGDDRTAHAQLRQDQRVSVIGQLTSGIAHDFNNLLQAISASLQFIERKAQKPEDVLRWASVGLQAVNKGSTLIAQLLAFTRQDPSALSLLDVSAELRGLEELFGRVLSPDIKLLFELDSTPAWVLCDATQLEAAVLNLLVNARDAMGGAGSIRVATRVLSLTDHAALSDGVYVELTVEDDGPGIPEAIARQAFEPFFTTKQAGKGTGLGLSQVSAFAAQAGGNVTLQCGGAGGTTVSLLLKIREGVDGTIAQAPAHSAASAAALPARGAKVLLVDDDDRLRDVMAGLLMDAGYAVESVSSGFAAIESIRRRVPDIVVSDCAMGDFSGVALFRVLREIWPGLPVLLLTGHADIEAVRAGCQAGAVIMNKPVSLEGLIAGIEGLLR